MKIRLLALSIAACSLVFCLLAVGSLDWSYSVSKSPDTLRLYRVWWYVCTPIALCSTVAVLILTVRHHRRLKEQTQARGFPIKPSRE